MPTTTFGHVKTIERRLRYLTDRIATWDMTSDTGASALHRYKAERNALLWAMPILRQHLGVPPYGEEWEQVERTELEAERVARKVIATQRAAENGRYGGIAPPADDTLPRVYG